jgi:hypothetical protein
MEQFLPFHLLVEVPESPIVASGDSAVVVPVVQSAVIHTAYTHDSAVGVPWE